MLTGGRDRLIVALAGALAVAIPLLLVWPGHVEVREAGWPLLQPIAPIVLPLTGAALTKPLFNEARSPEPTAPAASVEATAAPPPPAPPVLVGMILGRGTRLALVKLGSGETVTLGPGEEAGGWRLVGLARSGATFRSADAQIEVPLDFHNKPPADARPGTGTNAPPIPPPPPPGSPLIPPPSPAPTGP